MLYLTCTTISSVDLAQCGISFAKDWVSVKCGTNSVIVAFNPNMRAGAFTNWCISLEDLYFHSTKMKHRFGLELIRHIPDLLVMLLTTFLGRFAAGFNNLK